MTNRKIKYEEKFVAFVDVLGFKGLVEKSVANDDAESIAGTVRRLASDDDVALYREYGAEICPDSPKNSEDLSLCITQVSDCVIVSAEVSPAGAINIVNYCRKIAERLLLRECELCQGYLTKGKVYHQGTMIFGPAYQEAIDREKNAAAIEWVDGTLGTPFIEVDHAIASYLSAHGDQCCREQFSKMSIHHENYILISPYGIFSRMIDWAIDPNKTRDQMLREIQYARDALDMIEQSLSASKPLNERAREKLRISLTELSEARRRLTEADETIFTMESPFPAR